MLGDVIELPLDEIENTLMFSLVFKGWSRVKFCLRGCSATESH